MIAGKQLIEHLIRDILSTLRPGSTSSMNDRSRARTKREKRSHKKAEVDQAQYADPREGNTILQQVISPQRSVRAGSRPVRRMVIASAHPDSPAGQIKNLNRRR